MFERFIAAINNVLDKANDVVELLDLDEDVSPTDYFFNKESILTVKEDDFYDDLLHDIEDKYPEERQSWELPLPGWSGSIGHIVTVKWMVAQGALYIRKALLIERNSGAEKAFNHLIRGKILLEEAKRLLENVIIPFLNKGENKALLTYLENFKIEDLEEYCQKDDDDDDDDDEELSIPGEEDDEDEIKNDWILRLLHGLKKEEDESAFSVDDLDNMDLDDPLE